MKRVLYITNIEVPYKVRLFNELAKYCDLTVLYERKESSNRNNAWARSEIIKYHTKYLNGINVGNEYSFSFRILKYTLAKYDAVIVSCYNSPVQMMAILAMRILRIPYYLSVDGEIFLLGNGFKTKMKKFFLIGAKKYLAAGEKSAGSLQSVLGKVEIITYYFSSLTETELRDHAAKTADYKRNHTILIVGQYYDYKGMDIVLKAAQKDSSLFYKFVGMGKRTKLFIEQEQAQNISNVEIIPFLQKKDLEREYQHCAMIVLPSRQECWGLVVNEAASFGTPIVSTLGSGAAVEFLLDNYPQFLVTPGDEDALYKGIKTLLKAPYRKQYSEYLLRKSELYSIESSVKAHLNACDIQI